MSGNPSAQGWDDYTTDGLGVGVHPLTSPPTLEQVGATAFYAYNYAVNDQAWFNIHIKHDYLAGSKIYPHVHWSHDGIGNGQEVWFNITYSPAKGYSQQAYPAETSFIIVAEPNATTQMHQIDEASDAQSFLTNLEVDSLIKFRIKRISNGLTDFDGAVYIDQVDVHFESDGRMTNERNYPFTKYGV